MLASSSGPSVFANQYDGTQLVFGTERIETIRNISLIFLKDVSSGASNFAIKYIAIRSRAITTSNTSRVRFAGMKTVNIVTKIIDLDKPLEPKVISSIGFDHPNSVAIQFRYAFVTDSRGFHLVDITHPEEPSEVQSAFISLSDARSVYVARTYAYVSGGAQGLVIVDIERPDHPFIYQVFNDHGRINDLNDVKIATTNASLYAYLADGRNGLKVVQLTDPERVRSLIGSNQPFFSFPSCPSLLYI